MKEIKNIPTGRLSRITKVIQMKSRRNPKLRYSVASHSSMFRNRLQPAVRRKLRGLWYAGVVCSVTRPDVLQPVAPRNRYWIYNWRCYPFRHIDQIWHPQFSALQHLKDPPRGRHVRSDKEVNVAVPNWIAQQPKDVFFSRGIYALVEGWERCVKGGTGCIKD